MPPSRPTSAGPAKLGLRDRGLVERANGYFETSFLPGRSFASPAAFNAQLASWLIRANDRRHRTIGCRPADRALASLGCASHPD